MGTEQQQQQQQQKKKLGETKLMLNFKETWTQAKGLWSSHLFSLSQLLTIML